MPAVKTDMASVAGDFGSHMGTVSQAVPAAMSQVVRQHMRTRIKPSRMQGKGRTNKNSMLPVCNSHFSIFSGQ